jgi:hypothetical protein
LCVTSRRAIHSPDPFGDRQLRFNSLDADSY